MSAMNKDTPMLLSTCLQKGFSSWPSVANNVEKKTTFRIDLFVGDVLGRIQCWQIGGVSWQECQ
jgi:hypothetical protein